MRVRSSRFPQLVVTVAVVALMLGACASDERGSDGGDAVEAGGDGTGTTSETTSPPTTGDSDPVPSPGCGASEVSEVVEEPRTITVDDLERSYLLTVPDAHDGQSPLPIVFDFHGLMEGSEVHAGMSQYSALAEEEGFVVVFPNGTGEPLRWNANAQADRNIDLDFFDALVDQLGNELCLDTARVYSTGLSNGAMFTSLLICKRSEVIAAAAPVAGIDGLGGCEPDRPVPVVAFHGTEDPILRFNGGVDVSVIPGMESQAPPDSTAEEVDLDGEGYPATVAGFAERNGCQPEPTDTEITEEVIHRVYDCPDGADVEFYIVVGGGHSWPGSEFSQAMVNVMGYTTFDIDATRDGWEFMSRFSNP